MEITGQLTYFHKAKVLAGICLNYSNLLISFTILLQKVARKISLLKELYTFDARANVASQDLLPKYMRILSLVHYPAPLVPTLLLTHIHMHTHLYAHMQSHETNHFYREIMRV